MNQDKVLEVRSKNLQHLLETRFSGDKQSFADEIQVKPITLQKYLNAASDRACNNKAARKIERILGLDVQYLDEENHSEKRVYYITLRTDARYCYEVISILQKEPSIMECAIVLGNIDIFIKTEISIEKIPQLLFWIAKLPGVKDMTSYSSKKALRWQREQKEDMEIFDKRKGDMFLRKGIEKFIYRKMDYFFDEIKELEKGEITVRDNDIISLKDYQIIEGTEQIILTTRDLYESISGLSEYLANEKKLVHSGIEVKRIIFLPEDYKKILGSIKKEHKKFSSTGCFLRFLPEKKWIPSYLSNKCEQFFIIDNDFVCIRRNEQERTVIKRTPEMIKMYQNTFLANWDRALSLEELEECIDKNLDF